MKKYPFKLSEIGSPYDISQIPTLEEQILLLDYFSLLNIFRSEPELRLYFNVMCSAIIEGDINFDVKVPGSYWASGDKSLIEYIENKLVECIPDILEQFTVYGMDWWKTQSVKFGEKTIEGLPKFPNSTLGIIIFKWENGEYVPYFEPITPDRGTKGNGNGNGNGNNKKKFNFIIHEKPDFMNRRYSSGTYAIKRDIDSYLNILRRIVHSDKEIPQFVIQEKYPIFKTLTEYTISMLHGMHKMGKPLFTKTTTFRDFDQSNQPCSTPGTGSMVVGDRMQNLQMISSIEKNIPKLMGKDAFSGVTPRTVRVGDKKINTLQFGPYCTPEWTKKDIKLNDLLKHLAEIKEKSIQSLFGRKRYLKTTIGSQMEAQTTNYSIHRYKDIVEKTLKGIIKIMLRANKDIDLDPNDEEIDTKIEVSINTDDVMTFDVFKVLMDTFRGDPAILTYLVKVGGGINITEIRESFEKLPPEEKAQIQVDKDNDVIMKDDKDEGKTAKEGIGDRQALERLIKGIQADTSMDDKMKKKMITHITKVFKMSAKPSLKSTEKAKGEAGEKNEKKAKKKDETKKSKKRKREDDDKGDENPKKRKKTAKESKGGKRGEKGTVPNKKD